MNQNQKSLQHALLSFALLGGMLVTPKNRQPWAPPSQPASRKR